MSDLSKAIELRNIAYGETSGTTIGGVDYFYIGSADESTDKLDNLITTMLDELNTPATDPIATGGCTTCGGGCKSCGGCACNTNGGCGFCGGASATGGYDSAYDTVFDHSYVGAYYKGGDDTPTEDPAPEDDTPTEDPAPEDDTPLIVDVSSDNITKTITDDDSSVVVPSSTYEIKETPFKRDPNLDGLVRTEQEDPLVVDIPERPTFVEKHRPRSRGGSEDKRTNNIKIEHDNVIKFVEEYANTIKNTK